MRRKREREPAVCELLRCDRCRVILFDAVSAAEGRCWGCRAGECVRPELVPLPAVPVLRLAEVEEAA